MPYGAGKYTYELVENWAKLPAGTSFLDVGGISIDAQDRVFILNRSEHPVMVFDREGNFLSTWGEGQFKRAHGSGVDPDGSIWVTDDENHTVRKFTPEGKLLMTLGNEGQPSDTGYVQKWINFFWSLNTITRGGPPFNRPTGVAVSASGEIYVADGYGNARVHKFSPDGELLLSWGGPGYRTSERIQIFDSQGKFLDQWEDVFRPTDVFIDDDGAVYVPELCLRVSIFNQDGKLLARWEEEEATDINKVMFVAPHAIAVDSHGDIYTGDVAWTNSKIDRGPKTMQKFARIS
jgi:DNA-binding beta-propeller fold protein YncE